MGSRRGGSRGGGDILERRKMCGEHLAKEGSGDIEEFKSLLWDPDLSRKLKETMESVGPRKAGNSMVAKRYRELSAFHRVSHSLASSPTPTLKRPPKRSIRRH